MCGIIGAAGDIDLKAEKAVKTMLIFDTVRGEDSTGLFSAHKTNEDDYVLAKQVGNPFELFETRQCKTIFSRMSRVLIGHNRYATQGKVNKANAHPFDFDTLCGVHNGTLTNKHALADSYKFDVDSENLYHHIEKKGIEDAIKIARGAWALVWWDKINSELNFLRNEERPLFYTVRDDGRQLFWASEKWMLQVALSRSEIKHKDIKEFEQDFLHTVPVEKGGHLGKPILRKLERAAEMQTFQHNNGRVVQDSRIFPIGAAATTNGATNKPTSQTQGNVLTLPNKAKPDSRSTLESAFCGAKQVPLEAICLVQEPSGAEYVLCFCPDKPFFEIRLYTHHKHDVHRQIGCEFTADISGWTMVEKNVGFYKVSPHTVTNLTTEAQEEDTTKEYPDHHGKYLNWGEWTKQYGTCCFCSDTVLPSDLDEGARFTKTGDILCPQCIKDESLINYVELV